MTRAEITKEILVAAINRGLLDITDSVKTHNNIHDDRIALICKAYAEIAKAVNANSQVCTRKKSTVTAVLFLYSIG